MSILERPFYRCVPYLGEAVHRCVRENLGEAFLQVCAVRILERLSTGVYRMLEMPVLDLQEDG